MCFCNFRAWSRVLPPVNERLAQFQGLARTRNRPTVGLRSIGLILFGLILIPAKGADPTRPVDGAPEAARQVLTRFIDASGGETSLRKQPTRLTIGSFESPAMGVHGTIEILQAAPRQMFQKLIIASTATITMGTDGQQAWMNVPGVGVQLMDGLQRDQFIEESDLLALLEYPKRFVNLGVKPPSKVNGIDCLVVGGINKLGKAETMYFERASGLLLRWDRSKLDPSSNWADTETYFEDYREVDGVKLPFKISQKMPADQAFNLVITSVKHGVETTADRFKVPAK